jgi:hypothetical protein
MSMSIREYARHRGVSHTAVRKAIQAGRIQQEADGGIDPARADASWANNTRSSVETPRQPARRVETPPEPLPERQVSGNAPGAPDYNKARAVKEFYAARLAKLEFEEREGKLVNIDEINVQHFNRARRLRDRLLMIPRRLAAQLAAETDTRSVEEILDAAICEALEELSGVRRQD